ncbi:MAG: cell division protein FtsL [Gammaproteobacteria bacterium TMED78]|nr:MAG: cell division protein FtsL [Gammaproteobacteria bacterium TMED78]|tara:strand:+ start:880 stop:1173 length:294 start_codon:yes stop_codon:yes gene_type:complete
MKFNKEINEIFIFIFLAFLLCLSGIWIIQTKHFSRQSFIELESLNRERDRLQVEWGRLQLEESTWGNHPRVESIAREELKLALPDQDKVIMLFDIKQ